MPDTNTSINTSNIQETDLTQRSIVQIILRDVGLKCLSFTYGVFTHNPANVQQTSSKCI